MKRFTGFAALGVILIISLIMVSGCKKKSSDETVTQVKGSASFPAGVSGDLANSKVSLYLSYNDWVSNVPVKFVAVSGSGAAVSFAMTDVLAGSYYLDVWKDNDNSGNWSSGDFVGWYGSGGLGSPTLTPFQITTGATFSAAITMYIIAK